MVRCYTADGESSFRMSSSAAVASFLSLLLILQISSLVHGEEIGEEGGFRFRVGSPDLCPQQNTNRLEVLPGYGWDNLRNVEMGDIIDPQYTKCQVTADRKFLIPDQVQVHALKTSDVKIYSEIITNFTDYKSIDSRSVNVHASGGKTGVFKVSGSYSRDYIKTKENMVKNKATTTRSSFRWVYYRVRQNPESPINEAFKTRIRDLGHYVQNNNSARATYLSELMVRDYGTHIINRVDVGLILSQEDQIKSDYYMSHERTSTQTTIKAKASATFADAVGFKGGASYTHNETKESLAEYTSKRTNSELRSYGGPPIGADFSVNEWLKLVDNNLVTIDRAADPLWYVITTESLRMPELPMETVMAISDYIEKAVETYYKFNTYRGCTSVDAPNFSYMANVDDNTCTTTTANFTFGGVYQTCVGDLCQKGAVQLNPLTGKTTCPAGFTAIPLYEKLDHQCKQRCRYRRHKHHHTHWACWDDCGYFTDTTGHYQAFWCAAAKPVPAQTGYMFGGLYTKNVANPTTGDRSCPGRYTKLTVGDADRITICVSDDYELDFRYSLPFAGFFSCKTGNPLAEPTAGPSTSGQLLHANQGAMLSSKPEQWPRHCPKDFSQHLISVADGCEINFCVQTGSLSYRDLPLIRRPPFNTKPEKVSDPYRLLYTSDGGMMERPGGQKVWTEVKEENHENYYKGTGEDFPDMPPGCTKDTCIIEIDTLPILPEVENGDAIDGKTTEASLNLPNEADIGQDPSTSAIIAMSVLGTVLVLFVITAVVLLVLKRKKSSESWPQIVDNNHRTYGPL